MTWRYVSSLQTWYALARRKTVPVAPWHQWTSSSLQDQKINIWKIEKSSWPVGPRILDVSHGAGKVAIHILMVHQEVNGRLDVSLCQRIVLNFFSKIQENILKYSVPGSSRGLRAAAGGSQSDRVRCPGTESRSKNTSAGTWRKPSSSDIRNNTIFL